MKIKKEDYYEYKQNRSLSSFKHALIVIGVAFLAFMAFQFGTKIGQNTELNYYLNVMNPVDPNIEVGQTWIYILNKDNPFEDTIQIKKKIIGIKNDYILYIQSNSDSTINSNDTISENESYFIIGCELLKSDSTKFNIEFPIFNENIPEYKPEYEFKLNYINN